MFEAGQVNEGDRVTTPKGPGVVTKIATEVIWVFGEPIVDSRIVVKLDDKPDSHVRPVFYSSAGVVQLEADVEVVVELEDDAGQD